MLVNLLISKGLKAFGLLLMIGMKGVLLLSILSLNFSCGRWIFLAIRKRKLVSFLPGVSFCKFSNKTKWLYSIIIITFLEFTDSSYSPAAYLFRIPTTNKHNKTKQQFHPSPAHLYIKGHQCMLFNIIWIKFVSTSICKHVTMVKFFKATFKIEIELQFHF